MDFYIPNIVDILDILFMAIILFALYRMVKGTAAISIFISVLIIYLLWVITTALNMELLSSLLGQIIGIGSIALVVVFQQEIRRFLLFVGNKYLSSFSFFKANKAVDDKEYLNDIVRASLSMSESKTGALIVFECRFNLSMVKESGDPLNCDISQRLIETIFFKNSPLHDGALIIAKERLVAARCTLPSTERNDIPPSLGMRHRAAIGITEQSDAVVVVVSEESGRMSLFKSGLMYGNLNGVTLKSKLLELL